MFETKLKCKIKEYIKNIHDLKAQITNKEKIGIESHVEIPLPVITERNKEVKKSNIPYPPLPSFSNLPRTNHNRAEPVLRKQLTFSQINDGNYLNNQFYEANPNIQPHNFIKSSQKV